jgi:hypothetical protein
MNNGSYQSVNATERLNEAPQPCVRVFNSRLF